MSRRLLLGLVQRVQTRPSAHPFKKAAASGCLFHSSPSCRQTIQEEATTAQQTVSRRLYRILTRHVRELPSRDEFLLQPLLNPTDWGHAERFRASPMAEDNVESIICLRIFAFVHQLQQEQEDDMQTNSNILSLWYQDMVKQAQDKDLSEKSSSMGSDQSLWVTRQQLQQAIQYAFRQSSVLDSDALTIPYLHQVCLEVIQRLQQQYDLQHHTSISWDDRSCLRVVATSRWIGTARASGNSGGGELQYHFAYRIRVEHLEVPLDEMGNDDSQQGDTDTATAVQLLGRTWKIQEEHVQEGQEDVEPMIVHAPNTGAVGHLPVLRPGDVFEYMSGCYLTTPIGTMSGSFTMAAVPLKTKSARVGDDVIALREGYPKFEMPIAPFPLVAGTDKDHSSEET